MFAINLVPVLLSFLCVQAAEHDKLNQKEIYSSKLTMVNGHEATEHEAPYLAAIFLTQGDKDGFCGGTLVSANYVVTAAHCLIGVTRAYIILGAHKLSGNESSKIHINNVDTFLPHEAYNPAHFFNDIGLIKLPKSVEETQYVKYAVLPPRGDSEVYTGDTVRAYGWGKTSPTSGLAAVLNYIDVKVMGLNECYNYMFGVTWNNICTRVVNGTTACGGDSGGPLLLNGTVIGISSYGNTECQNDMPNVYTRVANYLDWIEKNSDVKIRKAFS